MLISRRHFAILHKIFTIFFIIHYTNLLSIFRKYKYNYKIIQYSNSARYKYKYYNIVYIVYINYEKFSMLKLIKCIHIIILPLSLYFFFASIELSIIHQNNWENILLRKIKSKMNCLLAKSPTKQKTCLKKTFSPKTSTSTSKTRFRFILKSLFIE